MVDYKGVIYFGLFAFFIGLALAVSDINSMLINIAELGEDARTLIKFAFTVIALGFLVGAVFEGG